MFELIEMTEEMKKKLDSDTRLCVINKMSNIIIWSEAAHWTEIEMGFYYERFYIAKDYTKIAFLFYLMILHICLMVASILKLEIKQYIIGVLFLLRDFMLAHIRMMNC